MVQSTDEVQAAPTPKVVIESDNEYEDKSASDEVQAAPTTKVVIQSDDEYEDKSITDIDVESVSGIKKSPDILQAYSIDVTGAGIREANGRYYYCGIHDGGPLFTLTTAETDVFSHFHLFHDKDEGRWLIIRDDGIACYECSNITFGYQICIGEDGQATMKKANIIADPFASSWETCGVGENPAPELKVVENWPSTSLEVVLALLLGLYL